MFFAPVIAIVKKILIIYPHFPPSNLAGVHRPRLFAQHLPGFGWEPTILTVHEKYYEENPDDNLVKLLPAGLRIEKVNSLPVTRPRLIGDIGLRAFLPLYRKAKSLIGKEGFDFLLIPIPSFYCALLGRWLHQSTGIRYGIDYIDPWVHRFPGTEKIFSRHWWSTRLAAVLEPIAVKKASLITGVAPGYYEGVLQRNRGLAKRALSGAMPYGGEKADMENIGAAGTEPHLFRPNGKFQFVYAGAMLPNAFAPLEAMLKAIAAHRPAFDDVEFHFIGTGKTATAAADFSIKPLAEKYGLWQTVIFEYPQRIAYRGVLLHLKAADGVFVLGSTEPHYTPSKIYQAVLAGKPLFALLHRQSTAVAITQSSGAGLVLCFNGGEDMAAIEAGLLSSFHAYRQLATTFRPEAVKPEAFEPYSAKAVTGQLAALLNQLFPAKENSTPA